LSSTSPASALGTSAATALSDTGAMSL
jgi:hypothetical protein